MATMNARYAGTCADCGQRFAAGALIDYNRRARRGKKAAHVDCNNVTAPRADACPICDGSGQLHYGNCRSCDGTGSHLVGDVAANPNRHPKLDTDGTPLAWTRHGWRRGVAHTGHRCIDAPCCGCCD